MRAVLTAAAFLVGAAVTTARPDPELQVWKWPAKKSFKDGDLVYTASLAGFSGGPPWQVTWVVKNAGKEAVPLADAYARFKGLTATDDLGNKMFVRWRTAEAKPGGALGAARAGEADANFGSWPGKKAKHVHIDFGPVEGKPALRMTIPAAEITRPKVKL